MKPKSFLKDLWNYERKISPNIEKKGPTITLGGKSGTGKSLFGEKLAQELDLDYISCGDLFRKISKEKGYSLEYLSGVRKKKVDLQVDKKTLKKSLEGGYVIVGRLSSFAAGKSADIRLLLTADPKIISKRLKKDRERKYYKKTIKEIMNLILKRDRRDSKKYKEYYGIDIDSLYTDVFGYKMPIYHAVLDNSTLPVKEMFELILKVTKDLL